MRVVILPIVTFTNTAGESEYVMHRQLARDVVKSGRDAFFYLVVPRHARAQVVNEPGIQHVFEDDLGVFYEVHSERPVTFGRLFSPRRGTYPVDAILTTRTGHASALARSLWDFRGPTIPVFVDESMAADYSSLVVGNTNDLDLAIRSMGYVSSAISFFDTQLELDTALRAGRRYLSGWALDQLTEKCRLFPCGLSTAKADRARAAVPERAEKFTLFFGGRLNAMKRADMLADIMERFYQSGRDVRVVLCTPKSARFLELRGGMEFAEVHTEMNSEQFLKKACEAHVMLNTSQIEGFSIGLMEQLYLINVVLLPKLEWVRSLLREKYDEWPFLYSTKDEAYTLLCWVFEHWEEARAMVAWLPAWIKENFDTTRCAIDMYDAMDEWVAENPTWRFSSDKDELLLRAVYRLKGEQFTIDDFFRFVVQESEVYRPSDLADPRRGKPSRWLLYKWLKANGFRDDIAKPIPMFSWTDAVPHWEGKFKSERIAEAKATEARIVQAMRAPAGGE